MTHMLDLDLIEKAAPRIVKRAPTNTKPLELNAAEKKVLAGISAECERLLGINGLSTSHQVRTMYAGIIGIDAVLEQNWNALAQTVIMGLRSCDEVCGVSAYIFQHTDGANRNLASPERVALKDLALRLNLAERGRCSSEADAALCLRALVCAAIAAERGLIHIAKENFGAIIRTLNHEDSPLRGDITWTDELRNYALRFANAKVKMP